MILILPNDAAPRYILRAYGATCITNFISWNKAYAACPSSTFVRYKNLVKQQAESNTDKQALMEKYERRGWTASPVSALYWSSTALEKHTWIISLNMENIKPKDPRGLDYIFAPDFDLVLPESIEIPYQLSLC